MKLNMYRFMGPDDVHPRDLKELIDIVTKPQSPSYSKSHGCQVILSVGKRETSLLFLRKEERKTKEIQGGTLS